MPRSKMLVSVHGDRPLFGDAGANAVGAFGRFRPDTTEPGSPVLEPAGVGFVAAMFDRDACRVTKEQRISGLAHHFMEPIDLLLGAEDQPIERFAKRPQLIGRQDPRRLAAPGVDAVILGGSLPGGRYLLDAPGGDFPLRDPIDVLGVPDGLFDRTPHDPPYLGRPPEYAPILWARACHASS